MAARRKYPKHTHTLPPRALPDNSDANLDNVDLHSVENNDGNDNNDGDDEMIHIEDNDGTDDNDGLPLQQPL